MKPAITEAEIKNAWFTYLNTGNMPQYMNAPWFENKALRPIIRYLPSSPRCHICYFPFKGVGGFLSDKLLGVRASNLNPHLCNLCERFATKYQGGVEIETAVVFVDIRNSTSLAEKMSAEEFSKLINRFYRAVTDAFYSHYGMVEKFQGDEVGGFFVRGFSGDHFVADAVRTAREALRALGYGTASGPWIEAGAGVHTGIAYIGSVTTNSGVSDISMLGDTVNTASRITAQAAPGEIILSEEVRVAANITLDALTPKTMILKGKSSEINGWVMKAAAQ